MGSVMNNFLSSWDNWPVNSAESASQVVSDILYGKSSTNQSKSDTPDAERGSSTITPEGNNNSNGTGNNAGNSNANSNNNANNNSSNFFPDLFKSSTDSIQSQLLDKFFEKFVLMALPPSKNSRDVYLNIAQRIEYQKSRPQLSVNIMSKNFIQLNSRLAIPFVFIDYIIDFFSWENPFLTISVLLIISLMILKPILLFICPLLFVNMKIIIPAYMKRHPPETLPYYKTNPVPSQDGPLKKVNTFALLEPVPEISREFVLNLTDLQNHMILYSIVYDFIVYLIDKYCFFNDDLVTSFIFLTCGIISFTVLVMENVIWFLIPYAKLLLILALTGFTVAMHPHYRESLFEVIYSEETRLKMLSMTNELETKISAELTSIQEEKEIREIEIYELQVLDPETRNWKLVGFTNEIYAPNSHIRLNTLPVDGSLTLDGIKPPTDWRFLSESELYVPNGAASTVKINTVTDNGSAIPEATGVAINSASEPAETNAAAPQQPSLASQSFSNLLDEIDGSTSSLTTPNEDDSKTNLVSSTEGESDNTDTNSGTQKHKTNTSQFKHGMKGWYLDLTPNEWVYGNHLQDVLDVDEDEKWCYDLVPILSLNTPQLGIGFLSDKKIRKARGEFRRRRWIRSCVKSYARYLPFKQPMPDYNDTMDVLDEQGEVAHNDLSALNAVTNTTNTPNDIAKPNNSSHASLSFHKKKDSTKESDHRRGSSSFGSLKLFHHRDSKEKSKERESDKRKSKDADYFIKPSVSNDSANSALSSTSSTSYTDEVIYE